MARSAGITVGVIMVDGIDSAVSIYQGSATVAKALVGDGVPEGVYLAHAWKRGAAYILDNFVIMSILFIATRGVFVYRLWNIMEFSTTPHITILHWVILLGMHWLYFKYTGSWMGRSLGQRWFGIALVHDDASPLGEAHWGRRAARKLIYALPVVGLVIFALIDYVRIKGDEKHQSSIDAAENTVAAVYWSLPWETRSTMR